MSTDGPYEGPSKGWTEIPTRELEALERKLAEQDQTIARLTVERDKLVALKVEVFDNPDKWMKWCDHKVLERCEAAEAEVARLLRMRVEDEQLATAVAEP